MSSRQASTLACVNAFVGEECAQRRLLARVYVCAEELALGVLCQLRLIQLFDRHVGQLGDALPQPVYGAGRWDHGRRGADRGLLRAGRGRAALFGGRLQRNELVTLGGGEEPRDDEDVRRLVDELQAWVRRIDQVEEALRLVAGQRQAGVFGATSVYRAGLSGRLRFTIVGTSALSVASPIPSAPAASRTQWV
eukprot:5066144-Prymnesium_polylepis.1